MIALRRQSIRSSIRTVTLLAALTSLLLTMLTPFVGTAHGAQLSVSDSLDQWANGKPGTDPATSGFWRNGNLNPQNSQYAEGDSVGFRRILGGFEVGKTYKVSTNYDTVNNDLVAYDYLTSWNRSGAQHADPTTDTSFSGAAHDLLEIPVPPRLANTPAFVGTPVSAAERQMAAWGADLLYVGNYRYSPGSGTDPYSSNGTTTTTVDIVFEATSSNVVLAWGGHIAVQSQWTYPTAPRNTNGSPYHMRNTGSVDRLEGGTLDVQDPATWAANTPDSGNAGSQDRSIKAGAILLPGLNIAKVAVDGITTVAPGDSFTYQIIVSNSGEAGSELTNVTMTDDVPDIFDVTAVTSTSPTCGYVDQLVTCAFASIAAGGSVTVDITVDVVVDPTVEGQQCGLYTNTANATADGGFDEDASYDVTVEGCEPDLDIVKSTDLEQPAEGDPVVGFGDTFHYLLTVTNAADATDLAINTVVTDTIPGAFSITGTPTYSGDTSGTCDPPAGQSITCSLGDLEPGWEVVISIPVEVNRVADGCDTFPNTGTVDADNHEAVESNTVDVEVAGCEPDVTLVKTAADDTVDVDGGTTSYQLVATNDTTATATATAVTVSDTVPAIFDIDSATYTLSVGGGGACTITGNAVSCGPVDLAPGDSITVTIAVTADPTNVAIGQDGDYCGTVTNAGQVHLGDDLADEDDVDVEITGCEPDVTLVKTAADDTVDVDGGTTSYQLVATNDAAATATATAVTVSDTVPAIFDIDSATYTLSVGGGGACTITGNAVSCGPVDLAPGDSITVTIAVTADPTNVAIGQDGDYCGTVTNAGQVHLGDDLADEDNVDVEITGCEPDLGIVKSTDLEEPEEGNPVVQLGESFNYLLTVTSGSDATAASLGVVVTDTVPGAFEITDTPTFDGDASGDCDEPTGQDIRCELGDLLPGDTVIITVPVTVRVVADSCDTYPNQATADADNTEPVLSNLVNVDVEGCISDLSLLKSASTGTVDIDGGSATYTLTATNAEDATATASDVSITDSVPTVFDITSATYSVDGAASVPCDLAGNDVSCGPVTLPPGSSMVVTIDVTANMENVDLDESGDFCGPVTNDGVLWEGEQAIDVDDVDIEIDGCDPDVSLLKSVEDDVTEVSVDGGTATFALTVENAADATATAVDVTITDVVDDAFRIESVTPADDCDVDGQTVTCGPIDLAPGQSYTALVEVSAVGGPDSCGTFPNAFEATWTGSSDGDVDSETSNQVTLDVVGCEPDIDLVKEVDVTEAAIGDFVTYTYTITNTGDLTLFNVTLTDLVEVNGALRDILELLGFDTTITLSPGETITLTSIHLVTEGDLPGPIDNVATVTGETEDGVEVSDSDDASVDPFGDPAIELDKVVAIPGADPAAPAIGVDPDSPGDTVIPYEFTVTNTGNVTLTDVTLTDIVLTEIPAGGAPSFSQAQQVEGVVIAITLEDTTLAPAESTTGTLLYQVRAADVENSVVVNVAQVTGVDPEGTTVRDEDPAAVSLVFPDEVEVLPNVVVKPAPVLPATGFETLQWALWAALVAGMGALLLLGTAETQYARRRG